MIPDDVCHVAVSTLRNSWFPKTQCWGEILLLALKIQEVKRQKHCFTGWVGRTHHAYSEEYIYNMKQERKGKLKGLGKERSPFPLTLATVFSSWESEKSSTTNRIRHEVCLQSNFIFCRDISSKNIKITDHAGDPSVWGLWVFNLLLPQLDICSDLRTGSLCFLSKSIWTLLWPSVIGIPPSYVMNESILELVIMSRTPQKPITIALKKKIKAP